MGIRANDRILAVAFTCADTIRVGDIVELSAAGTVAIPTAAASVKVVGTVAAHTKDATVCTVNTRFREYRYGDKGRTAAAAIAAGSPIVMEPDGKVSGYTAGTRARHDGTATGPVTIVEDSNDSVKAKLEGGSSQTVQLTAGADVTFATIAAELNAGLTGMHAEVDSDGHINLVSDQIGRSIEIEAVANDAYTLLGWTAAVYLGTNPSHDSGAIIGLAVTAADEADDVIETLEY